MPALDFNQVLDGVKTNLELMTVANGYTFDAKKVSRTVFDPSSELRHDEIPAFMIFQQPDELRERDIDITTRKFPVFVGAYVSEEAEGIITDKVRDIETLKMETMNLFEQAYKNPSGQILRVDITTVDPSELDERAKDADFVIGLDFIYFM